jgi:citrate lyase beta subunit
MRSLLYVPGNSERMILKAHEAAADGLILDLEDAIAPEQKLEARATVAGMLREIDFSGREVFVRINSLQTEWGLEDARAVSASGVPGIVIPKLESVDDVTTIAPIIKSRYHQHALEPRNRILCQIETPRGVCASRELAEANELVAGLIFGAADLAREIGCLLSEDEVELLFARSQVLISARAAGVAAYDSPHFAVADLQGLRRRTEAARKLGYDGMTIIHPSHIEIVNEIFTPTAEQIAEAQRVVEALEAAHAVGRGVTMLEGKMVDQLHLTAAKKLLKKAK